MINPNPQKLSSASPDTQSQADKLLCTDGLEHRIGQDAVDSGHGARPSGPQKCLKCGMTLHDIIQSAREDECTLLIERYTAIARRTGSSPIMPLIVAGRLSELKKAKEEKSSKKTSD